MNRLLQFGVALLIASPLLADTPKEAKPPADLSGTWQIHISFGGRPPRDSVLKLEKSGDTYTGIMTDMRGQGLPVKELKYKDGDLTFIQVGEQRGQKFTLEYSAKVTGDTLKGKMTIAGRNFSLQLQGRRESPAEGVWKITMVLGSGQKLTPSIKVKHTGEKLAGDYVGIEGNKAEIPEVKLVNGEVSFDAPDHADKADLVFHYSGKMTGDTIKGSMWFKGDGNQKVSLPFEAKKSKVQTADVAGTWKLRVPTRDGATFEPTLKLAQQGATVTGTYAGEQGDTKIVDGLVLADEFSFEVTRTKDGKSYRLRYQGKVSGDTYKGSVDYNFDGMTGYFDFEGKRVAPAAAAKQ